MRVLFMPAPAIGHAFPMVPLAWAFRTAGHEVAFVAAGDGLTVGQAGLPVLDALPGRTTSGMLADFVRDVPAIFEPLGASPVEAMNERKPLIIAAWDPYVDEHVAVAERFRPDLVVYDPLFGVGPLVAAKCAVPAVTHAITLCRFSPELLRDMPAAAALRRHGLEVGKGIRTIDVAPPSLAEGPPSELAMRYVPYNGGGVLPDWLLTPPRRPRIAVTFGSLYGSRDFVGRIERIAAAAPDLEFVVTLGKDLAIAPGDLPPNVLATGWVPLNALLRTCSAAVHHGGDGTILTCCALGVVQLTLPNAPDEVVNGELLRARGAAHVMDTEADLDTAAIRGLLADDGLHRAARELRAEMNALPAPMDIVPRLAGSW